MITGLDSFACSILLSISSILCIPCVFCFCGFVECRRCLEEKEVEEDSSVEEEEENGN
jgi:hypothetical protein